MKKANFFALVALCLGTIFFGFSSCDDDTDTDENVEENNDGGNSDGDNGDGNGIVAPEKKLESISYISEGVNILKNKVSYSNGKIASIIASQDTAYYTYGGDSIVVNYCYSGGTRIKGVYHLNPDGTVAKFVCGNNVEKYTYNSNKQIVELNYGSSSLYYVYDDLGCLVSIQQKDGVVINAFEYTFDKVKTPIKNKTNVLFYEFGTTCFSGLLDIYGNTYAYLPVICQEKYATEGIKTIVSFLDWSSFDNAGNPIIMDQRMTDDTGDLGTQTWIFDWN